MSGALCLGNRGKCGDSGGACDGADVVCRRVGMAGSVCCVSRSGLVRCVKCVRCVGGVGGVEGGRSIRAVHGARSAYTMCLLRLVVKNWCQWRKVSSGEVVRE